MPDYKQVEVGSIERQGRLPVHFDDEIHTRLYL
jgi:hypothetical protein